MHATDDRYTRELRRLQLAQRMVRHNVRTLSICDWTGVSAERVRKFCHAYDLNSKGTPRHRGPAPTRAFNFVRSPGLRSEASALGGMAYRFGVLPAQPVPDARRVLPGIERGERLCHVFEVYREVVPESHFTMDQFILVVMALAEGQSIAMDHCGGCHAALLIDRLAVTRKLCSSCRSHTLDESPDLAAGNDNGGRDTLSESQEHALPARQRSLF